MGNKQPLAFLLRPTSTSQIVGQTKVLNNNGLIKKMINHQFATSLIFYGPPGTGKTSFATALANDLNIKHETFNASFDKKEKLIKIISQAMNEQQFILIIDEIHRMNKDKQDLLLEHMEKGNLKVFSTTTENPFFVINPAIRSRSSLIKINPITTQEMMDFFNSLFKTNQELKIDIDQDALRYLCEFSTGDLRSAINNLELLLNLYSDQKISLDLLVEILPFAKTPSSGYGDDFHDLKSALQKSVRGSDVDAAIYYFARLVQIGDFETLMRRMIIMAYEDIGLANPSVPMHVVQATEAFRQTGYPEGIIPLGLAIVEMAISEKSNSAYVAVNKAIDDVESGMIYSIPKHLKDSHYKSASKLGSGVGYKNPHDYPNDWIKEQYLPKEVLNVIYFNPKNSSVYEKRIVELYNKMKSKK